MVIREAGILFRDFSLVKAIFIKNNLKEIYNMQSQELVTSLLGLVEEAFLTDLIEYLGGNKYVIAFIDDKILVEDSNEQESIIIYCIVDNKKKIDKYIYRVILPLLKKILKKFKSEFQTIDSLRISQIQEFETKISEILGDETKTIDQKLRDSLF